ncbi:MAG TPA: tetratricopeptide repeat protein [Bacteroidia bacterium]|nr:tetratricopeptide repeat protein [Bacteroidia bacterium]
MKVKFLAFLLFFCSYVTSFSQRREADSIKNILIHSKEDTSKIFAFLQLGTNIENSNPDTALILGTQALALSRKLNWVRGIVESLSDIGLFYEIKGAFNIAFTYEDSALRISEKNGYSGNLNSIYNELGNITSDQNNYAVGLGYYFKALRIDSLLGKNMVAGLCNNIGLDYQDLGDYVKAEEYYIETEKIFEASNNTHQTAAVYGNLGSLYYLQGNYQKGLKSNFRAFQIDSSHNDLGGLIAEYQNIGLGYLYLKNYQNALQYTFKALAFSRKTGELGNIPKAFLNISATYLQIYQSDSAHTGFTFSLAGTKFTIAHEALIDSSMAYEKLGMAYADSVNDKLSYISAIQGLGNVHMIKKDYPAAIKCFQQAFDIADSLGVLEQELEFAQALGNAFSKAGNYQAAVKYFNKTIALKDSVFGIDKSNKMAEMEAAYQDEKMQKEIDVLGQKNEIQNLRIKQNSYFIYGLASLAILISVIAFLLIRQNRINTKNTRIELEQKLLRSQMNPHFIFNAITSIQNYIYKEKPQEAANYLSSVFKLMRTIIESSKEEYVILEKEISSLKHYLILQQLCSNEKFDFTIDVDPNVDAQNILIPPMMAQPFIENAIEHGIANKPEKGIITVRISLQNTMLLLEIEDNGIGREKAKEISQQHSGAHLSIATNITQERIALLNKNLKKKITMQIIDLKNEQNKPTGTKVIFVMPLNRIV